MISIRTQSTPLEVCIKTWRLCSCCGVAVDVVVVVVDYAVVDNDDDTVDDNE